MVGFLRSVNRGMKRCEPEIRMPWRSLSGELRNVKLERSKESKAGELCKEETVA